MWTSFIRGVYTNNRVYLGMSIRFSQYVIESEIVEVLIMERDENAKKLIKYTFGKPKRRNSFWIGLDLVSVDFDLWKRLQCLPIVAAVLLLNCI